MSALWRRSALALVLSGCSALGHMEGASGNASDGSDSPRDGRADGSDSPPGDGDQAKSCDIEQVFALPENGCTNAGCHGAQYQGNLDLASPGLAARLLAHVSSTDACGGERMVDPENPDDSLLLRLIDPARFAEKPCGVMMPLGSEGTSPETIACVESWIASLSPAGDEPEPEPSHEAMAAESYVNKVKTLLTGKAASAAEIAQVKDDPGALERLALDWVDTPEFETKLSEFLAVALQQRIGVSLNAQFMGLRGSKLNLFRANLEESFVRTAVAIVKERRPFTEILTTQKWMVTTATLAALTYLDLTQQQLAAQRHTVIRGPGEDSVLDRVWHVASMPNTCTPRSPISGFQMLELLMGFSVCQEPANYRFDDSLLTTADFSDWRPVELVKANGPAAVPDFYDLDELRSAVAVKLMVPRLGFFTSPAFLINWETNEDNQFRVTTSQTLIVALGSIFSAADPTEPVRLEGLAREHAEPGSTCFGCHQHLDPMRMYFAKDFSFAYQRTPSPTQVNPSFAFGGTTDGGSALRDFAQTLARHPSFATGWTQKICYWANSQACHERDPEFERIAKLFVDSGYDLKKMVAALVSSRLVTFATESALPQTAPAIVSITRKQHLCQLLDARLGTTDTCSVAANFAGLIPEDAFSRGAAEPVQSAVTGLFHYAAAEKLCMRLAARLVGAGLRFDLATPEAALDSMVSDLMGLGEGHPRAPSTRQKLAAHYAAAKAQTNAQAALRSAFTVSCMSPEVMAVGL